MEGCPSSRRTVEAGQRRAWKNFISVADQDTKGVGPWLVTVVVVDPAGSLSTNTNRRSRRELLLSAEYLAVISRWKGRTAITELLELMLVQSDAKAVGAKRRPAEPGE